jgi:hypothetical protein
MGDFFKPCPSRAKAGFKQQFNHRRIMKKNILFLLFLVFSSVALSNFKFPNEAQQGTIFLNIERYKSVSYRPLLL